MLAVVHHLATFSFYFILNDMGAQWSQFFPGRPTFTEDDVEPQDGKVFIVTGPTSGIGFELVKLLYSRNARVYLAGRASDQGKTVIEGIRASHPTSNGSLHFLHLELDDLASIKSSVLEFQAQESKLHVLWNNAGVSQPPAGSVSKQGIELQLATNCLGPFLLTQLLTPQLEAAAADETTNRGSVRVVWTASQIVELSAPQDGIIMSELTNPPNDRTRNYVNSKTGNLFLSTEFARRVGQSHGIMSVAHNPGAASTNLFRHTPLLKYLAWPLLHEAKWAAYTALFSGLSTDIGLEQNGCYVAPWGKVATEIRKDLADATKPREDGGTGKAALFWDFCCERTVDYA